MKKLNMNKTKSPLKHTKDGHMMLTKEAHIEQHGGDAVAAGYDKEEESLDKAIESSKVKKDVVEEKIEKPKKSSQVFGVEIDANTKPDFDRIAINAEVAPYEQSGLYSEEEINTIKRYKTRLKEDQPLLEEVKVTEDAYKKFGEDNVIRISEEMNMSPHFLDLFKSENSNIYRVKDKTDKISPKLVRIKDNGETEFITSKELKDLDPNFYLKLNDDTKAKHYKPLDEIKEHVINSFGDYDEDKAYEHLKEALEPYGITVSIPMIPGDYIKLSVNGKDKKINLNARYIQDAPGPLSVDFRNNSGSKIFNQIENFVKENGKQSKVYDHEENTIEKNIREANEFSEEYDNSIGVTHNTIKDIETEISNAETLLPFYNEKTSEQDKKEFLEQEGLSTELINVKDYAIRNNIVTERDANEIYTGEEFITELELKTRGDLHYGLDADEYEVYNGKDLTQKDKDLFVAADAVIEQLKLDKKDVSVMQYFSGLESTDEEIDVSNKDLQAVLVNLLEEKKASGKAGSNFVTKLANGGGDFLEKEELLKEARTIVLNNYYVKKQVEVDQFDKEKNEFETSQLDFDNDLELFNDRKTTLEGKVNPIKEKIISSIDKVEDIDTKIDSLVEDAKEIEEDAKTDEDSRDVYNGIYNDYQDLLLERETLVAQYNVDRGEFETILKSDEYKQLNNGSVDLQNRQNYLSSQTEVLNKRGSKLHGEFKELYNEIGYDAVEGVFKDSYKSVTQYKEWKNSNADNPTMDAIGAFNEGMTDQVLKAFALIPEAVSYQAKQMYGDDPNTYSQFDAMSDIVYDYIKEDKFGSYTEREGTISEAGWSYKNITRTMAEMLPFTLGIMHAGRKGDVKSIKNAYTRFSGGTLDDMAMKINITKRTYSLTLYDNYHEAKELGLGEDQALQYATFMSSATAMSQLIMPDNLFLKGNAATNTFKSNLVKGIYGTTTIVAGKEIIKNSFKNLAKELGEEEMELLFDDLNKASFFAKHESMFLDAEAHADLAMGTLILSGGIQQVGNVKTFNAVKKRVRAEFKYRGLETLQLLQGDRDHVNMKLGKFKGMTNPPADKIAKLEQTLEELDAAMIHGRAEMDAINNAPSYASTEHIDLIVEKNKLINKKSSATGKELDEINEKIKGINTKLESTNAYERYQSEQNKDVERSEEIVKEEIGENTVVYESDSKEEQAEAVKTNLNERSTMLEEEMNDIKQDENGNAVNLQEQPTLSKLKNEKG